MHYGKKAFLYVHTHAYVSEGSMDGTELQHARGSTLNIKEVENNKATSRTHKNSPGCGMNYNGLNSAYSGSLCQHIHHALAFKKLSLVLFFIGTRHAG